MNTNTIENQPAAAGRDGKRGHGAEIAAGVAIAFALVVLLVLPGFLAAGFSRANHDYFYVYGETSWRANYPGLRTGERMELVFLAPSGWLMGRSEALGGFYLWQYDAARGFVGVPQIY